MKPAVSVVIPVRDSSETLAASIKSIRKLKSAPKDIIIVDDGSKIPVSKSLHEHDVQILRLDAHLGPAGARNAGARIATGEVVLFMDADVLIDAAAIDVIQDEYERDATLDAIQGMYSLHTPVDLIASKFQNYYYHFAFRQVTETFVAICASYCFAIRRDVFLESGGFDESIKFPTVEDEEYGYKLFQSHKRIKLEPKLIATHLASYSIRKMFLRKIRMSQNQIKSVLRGIRPPRIAGRGNLTHHADSMLIAVLLAPMLPMSVFGGLMLFIVITGLYFMSNSHFWKFLFKQEPFMQSLFLCFLTWIDQLAIFGGITLGTCRYLFGAKY